MTDPIMHVEGGNGQIELYEDKIRITRKGWGAKLMQGFGKGSKEILLEDITSIQIKEPGRITAGYIQFGQSGYSESQGGLMAAGSDENSVQIDHGQTEQFRKLKKKINELRKTEDTGSKSGSAIQKLRERFANGEISKEEYQEKLEVLKEN